MIWFGPLSPPCLLHTLSCPSHSVLQSLVCFAVSRTEGNLKSTLGILMTWASATKTGMWRCSMWWVLRVIAGGERGGRVTWDGSLLRNYLTLRRLGHITGNNQQGTVLLQLKWHIQDLGHRSSIWHRNWPGDSSWTPKIGGEILFKVTDWKT